VVSYLIFIAAALHL